MIQGSLQVELDGRLEGDDNGEWGPLRAGELLGPALHVGAVEATVERDHLAVQVVDGAQPEVAMLGELREGHVALVGALQQCAERGCLEEDVRVVARVEVGVAHRLHVQRADPALVEAHSGASVRAVFDFATSRWSGLVPSTRSLRLLVTPCQKCSFLKWWSRWFRWMVL